MNRRLKTLGTTLLLTLLLCSSGCSQSIGALWPDIKVGPSPTLTPEEAVVAAQFAKENPELARKIIGRNNELSAAIKEYHKQMIAHNRMVAQQAGMESDKIDLIYPKE